MLVACRLAGLSALETYYVRVRVGAQFPRSLRQRRDLRSPCRSAGWQGEEGPSERKRAALFVCGIRPKSGVYTN
jgi:hypothetical protein